MSRLTSALGSFMSATNENYAALANVKFDFSLIKMEAPVEFSGVVSALSTMRRVDAEQGPSHKTARRLGALFEDVVPTTPKLISAYGLRMSEIMNTPGVNDIGADQHGPFGPYVGADGTSLWAAATSGISALGVYLLSCLLARTWDSKTATAIWVEIVAAARLVPERLRDYMCALTSVSTEQAMDDSLSAPGVSLVAEPHRFHTDFSKSLYALESCSMIYSHLSRATISLKPIMQPLHELAWFESLFSRWKAPRNKASAWANKSALLTSRNPPLPDRSESFSCIAWFDSGTVDLTREDLQHAFALCSEDTIYVPAVVLSDPFRRVPEYEMRSITGNVSRAGISILVSPIEPRVRDLSDSYNVVTHETYDRKREDNFKETSLHLSFTE